MLLSSIHSWIGRLNRLHVILILTALGLLAFASAVNHPFVHDDVVFIQQNPDIGDLNVREIFFQSYGPEKKLSLINKYYRPLLELINRVLYRIIGFSPHGFHFVNVLLHIFSGFLVYSIIKFILKDKGISLATAIFFLLHPVQNEAVACISGISNLVFTFLCLLSFYAYLVSIHSKGAKIRPFLYGMSLILFLLALFSKEQSVILPFLIIAYEGIFLAEPIKKALKRYGLFIGGYFIVMAGYFIFRKIIFGFALLRPADNQGELWIRMLAIPRSLLTYLGLIFFPHDLHYYRSQDILLPYLLPLLGIFFVVLVIIFIVYKTPKPQKTWMLFGLAWFIISLGPTLNIVPLINEYSYILTSEHFLYFPLIGMALFAISGVHYWIGEKTKRTALVGFVTIVLLSSVFIHFNIRQNTYWRGEIPLFERTLKFQKNFGRVRFLLAKAYATVGRYEDAIREDRKALAIMQGYERKVQREDVKKFYLGFIKGIRYHLGFCLDILGEDEAALSEFKEALALAPDNPAIHFSVGLSYIKQKDMVNAETHFERSLELDEGNLIVMNSLAICYKESGQYDKAEKFLREIARQDSKSVSARQNLENFLKKRQAGGF